jgi:hypothetical protein
MRVIRWIGASLILPAAIIAIAWAFGAVWFDAPFGDANKMASKSDARRSEVSGSKACTSLAPSMAGTTRAVRNGFVSMANQRRTIQNIADMAQKSGIDQQFIVGVRSVVIPGTTLVFTDQPVGPKTQSAPGFKILGPGEVTQG